MVELLASGVVLLPHLGLGIGRGAGFRHNAPPFSSGFWNGPVTHTKQTKIMLPITGEVSLVCAVFGGEGLIMTYPGCFKV